MDSTVRTQVTELVQLRNLNVSITDVTWNRLRISSSNWLCVLRRTGKKGKGVTLKATCINPLSTHIRSFETDGLTSAQVNPERDVIALATRKKIFIVCLERHVCLGWHPLKEDIEFWSWISRNVIVMVGREKVYMWNYSTDMHTTLFNRHARLRNCQVTQCVADSTLSWFALTALYRDKDGSVSGVTQVHSSEYNQSNCIEAHAAAIVDHKLSSRIDPSRFLIISKKCSSFQAKICMCELGPSRNGKVLISRIESFPWKNEGDIPCHLVCSPRGLIFLVSKLGSFYAFNLESCTPLILHERICPDIIIGSVLDQDTGGIIVASRNGQILSIDIQFDSKKDKTNLIMRNVDNVLSEQVTRL